MEAGLWFLRKEQGEISEQTSQTEGLRVSPTTCILEELTKATFLSQKQGERQTVETCK